MIALKAVLAIAQKDMRLLLRDKGEVFFTFAFPAILAVFFGFVFGGDGESSAIDLAVVNESTSKLAASIERDLISDESFIVTRVPTRENAIIRVRDGSVVAAVILPATIEDGISGLFSNDGGGISLEAIVDPARRAEAGLIQGKLNELAFRQFPKIITDSSQRAKLFDGARESLRDATGMSATQRLAANAFILAGEGFMSSLPQAETTESSATTTPSGEASAPPAGTEKGWSPITVTINELPPRKGLPRSAFDVSFPQGIVWGLAGCIAAFAVSLVAERTRGALDRLRIAPISRMHLLAGKGLACFATALLVQVFLITLAVLVFGATIAQPGMLAVACVCAAFGFSGLAMLIAGIARTEAQASGAGRGAILLLAMIGGGTIPLFFMPSFMRTLSNASPFRWAVNAIEGPFWRDTPPADQLIPLAILVLIGIVSFLIGSRAIGQPFAR